MILRVYFYFTYERFAHIYVSALYVFLMLWRSEEDTGSPETGVAEGCKWSRGNQAWVLAKPASAEPSL